MGLELPPSSLYRSIALLTLCSGLNIYRLRLLPRDSTTDFGNSSGGKWGELEVWVWTQRPVRFSLTCTPRRRHWCSLPGTVGHHEKPRQQTGFLIIASLAPGSEERVSRRLAQKGRLIVVSTQSHQ